MKPDDVTAEDTSGPVFGPLSQPYKAAVLTMRDPRRAPPMSDPRATEGLTDTGVAERLRDDLSEQLKFDHLRRVWMKTCGGRWVDDSTGERYVRVIEAIRGYYLDAVNITNLPTREATSRFYIKAESRHSIENALELLKHLPPIAERGDRWNADVDEINTPSGAVNLRTRHVRDTTPADLVTFSTTVMYNPGAVCPTWDRTVLAAMNDDPENVAFFQRAFGYSITGEMREQVFFVLYGTGANGKSTIMEAVASVMGDYFHAAAFSTFEAGQRASIGNDLAGLPGRRIVSASEINSGTKLNTARIKALTGGDRMNARHLYGHAFEFYPMCKLWLGVNHRPRIADDSVGIWRRVLLIPFLKTFTGALEDKHLKAKLHAEREGILRWCVDGAATWYAEGLNPPAIVRDAVADYKHSSDPLAVFFDERVRVDPTLHCRAADLYAAYGRWCEGVGIGERSPERLSLRAFGELVKVKVDHKKRSSGIVYLGITCTE